MGPVQPVQRTTQIHGDLAVAARRKNTFLLYNNPALAAHMLINSRRDLVTGQIIPIHIHGRRRHTPPSAEDMNRCC
jgi:hypothetical protein